MKKSLRIAMTSCEVAPYARTGGLADVSKALAKELASMDHHVVLITPFYGFIRKQNLKLHSDVRSFTTSIGYKKYQWGFKHLEFSPNLHIYFIANHDFFGRRGRIYGYEDDNLRFMFFDFACLQLLEVIHFNPHVIHCHDWQSGLIPNILNLDRSAYPSLEKSATLFTIHNISFQFGGNWSVLQQKHKDDGKEHPPTSGKLIPYTNFTKRGIVYADVINTVSERYALEILTPVFGCGLERCLVKRKKDLYGIINGIDYTIFNPAFDKNIYARYDWNSLRRKRKNKLALQKEVGLELKEDVPLVGVVNRLTEQKGFRLIMDSMPALLRMDLQIVFVGSGLKEYVQFFKRVAKEHPKKVGFYSPFSEQMASRVYAGSDMYLMPSRYEPCGISQLISLRYGSIPIVHETGGLSDTIRNYNPKSQQGNGFVFKTFTKEDFLIALTRALENYKYPQIWEYLTWRAMQQSYSWELPAKKYLKLYQLSIKKHE